MRHNRDTNARLVSSLVEALHWAKRLGNSAYQLVGGFSLGYTIGMKRIMVNCQLCGKQVERTQSIRPATCFTCKKERRTKRNIMIKLKSLSTARVAEQS